MENIPNQLELNDQLNYALHLMENTDQNMLVEGKAGSGKSTLIRIHRKNTKKQIVVLAPTGLSALNIDGETIHSFFRFPPRMINDDEIKLLPTSFYRTIDAIIIDEISMVRADVFDNIDRFMRRNGRDSSKPFGGVQMILVGDLHQLPPVVTDDDAGIIDQLYESPYFFDSRAAKTMNLKTVTLTKVYRQTDVTFLSFLDRVRSGKITAAELEIVNSRLNKIASSDGSILTLTTTNYQANKINEVNLKKLPGESLVYTADIEGEFRNKGKDLKNLPVDLELHLRKGARVIFVKNDAVGRWVNGTLGTVVDLGSEAVIVKLDGNSEEVTVTRETWQQIRHGYDRSANRIFVEVIGELTQIPLRLAWAVTIHKSQGLTFDKVVVDFTHPPWDNGQAYVALSRCRTLDGISLKEKIWPNDIKVSLRVAEFLKNVQLNSIPDAPESSFTGQSTSTPEVKTNGSPDN